MTFVREALRHAVIGQEKGLCCCRRPHGPHVEDFAEPKSATGQCRSYRSDARHGRKLGQIDRPKL